MPRHLIVSCGTSQVDERKIGGKGLNLSSDLIKSYERLKRNSASIDDNSIKTFTARSEVTLVHDALIKNWVMMSEMVGKPNNPFGAELSTLKQMQNENRFDPAQDSITILYSDTEIGAYCAAILNAALRKGWSMNGRVELKRIEAWKENSSNAKEAEKNLWHCTHASINLHKDTNSEIFLVITGGFKSMIPFFTLIALIHGFKMYYLFEDTAKLRCIEIPARVKSEAQTFWQRVANVLGVSSTDEKEFIVKLTGGLENEPEEKRLTPPTE